MSVIFFIAAVFFSEGANSAPCCASANSISSLITGDESAQITLSASSGSVVADASDHALAIFRENSQEQTQIYRLGIAKVFFDRWQFGLSAPIVQHNKKDLGKESTGGGLGDIAATAGYEFLPEWSYSPWKPRGHVFIQWTAPTGRSTYQSNNPQQTDVTGTGFYSLDLGVALTKRWSNWDAMFIPSARWILPANIVDAYGSSYYFYDAFGTSALFGIGYSPNDSNFRFGTRFQPQYTSPKSVDTGYEISTSQFKLTWDFGVDVNYLFNDEWTITGAYTDQTLFGPAVNSTLSRTFALNLQKRWLR